MHLRSLTPEDIPALRALLMREPHRNPFHLSALAEHGLPLLSPSSPRVASWAMGAFREGELVGALAALRGTGGVYHTPGDEDVLRSLSAATVERATDGSLSLLSGHAAQLGPLLPLISGAGPGRADMCHYRTLYPTYLSVPPPVEGFSPPRFAAEGDMERLIDFYMVGFYSLAHLPSRTAWRNRLSEQLAHRSLFFIEDTEGRVVSAALSSAEGGGAAMLGGVATLLQCRGKGLSPLCVGALCQHLLGSRGMRSVSLFYLQDNTQAGRVYEKLGFVEDGEWLLIPLGHAFGF